MPARLIDVATAAGVTKSTASRVLNGDPTVAVRPETRQRIVDAAAHLDYAPHSGARALAAGRTMTIAVITPQLDNPTHIPLMRGLHARAAELGYFALMVEDLDGRPIAPELLARGRVDGVVVGSAFAGHPLVDHLASSGLPHVYVNRAVEGSGRNVTMDVAAASRTAVEFLRAAGHARLAHLAGPDHIVPSRERRLAFEAAAPGSTVVEAGFTEVGGYDSADALLASGATAIFTSSLGQGIGLLRRLHELGAAVPGDVAVLANDEVAVGQYLTPSLSTVAMPLEQLGAAAADAVIAQIEGGEPQDVTLATSPRVIERETTRR